MPAFIAFRNRQLKHVTKLLGEANYLYTVDVDKEILWDTYLRNFPDGTNEKFRERTSHDCTSCRHYVQGLGNVVSIKDGVISTMWDFDTESAIYQPVVDALAALVRQKAIKDFYVTKFPKVGMESNVEVPEDGSPSITWKHMYAVLPAKHVNSTMNSDGSVAGSRRDIRNVFKRGLTEITEKAITDVLELIECGSVYRGAEWKANLKKFLGYHKAYRLVPEEAKDIWCWEKCLTDIEPVMAIKNTVMGTLLMDIAEGKNEDAALESFGKKMDPANYKRPTANISSKMIDATKKELEGLGYIESLPRRHAALGDITVNNTIFSNKDAVAEMAKSPFDAMKSEVPSIPKNIGASEEIHISKFISDVVPFTDSIEVMFENRHASNMVSLIAPKNEGTPSMFKWDNGFSWAYSGNLSDSRTKDLVKAAGGKVDGVLRFSIRWNDNKDNENDFDAHCIEPNRNEIYYTNKGMTHPSSGILDVDIVSPSRQCPDSPAVENITWSDLKKMPEGVYKFFVHTFSHNGGRSGFSAEIEANGVIHQFEYKKDTRSGSDTHIAEVTYSKKDGFTVRCLLSSSSMVAPTRTVWGLPTNQFHPVSILMYSPNYWDENKGNGNLHYMFMLKGCTNSEGPNGFMNEFLKDDLMKHRKVLEVLGGKMAVEPTSEQLSGLGFSSTKHDHFVCKVSGRINRTFKVIVNSAES
jgi:hypothetical protein